MRGGGTLGVVLEPVTEHVVLGQREERRRHRDRRELLLAPALLERVDHRPRILLELALLHLLEDRVHGLADPGVVAARPAEAELVAEHVHQLARLEVRQTGVRDADRLVERPAGVGPITLEPPSTRVDLQGDQPVERRHALPPRAGRVGEMRTPRCGRLSRGDRVLERSGGRGRPRARLDEARAARSLVGVVLRVGAGEHHATSRPREHQVEEAPFVVEAVAVALGIASPGAPAPPGRTSARVCDRLGKVPSLTPVTSTVSNSRATVPCAVRTCTASDRPRSQAEYPGPCSPASSDSRNAATPASALASSVSATTFAKVTTVSSSRRASALSPAFSTSRREQGRCSQRCRNASCTLMPANSAALRERLARAPRPRRPRPGSVPRSRRARSRSSPSSHEPRATGHGPRPGRAPPRRRPGAARPGTRARSRRPRATAARARTACVAGSAASGEAALGHRPGDACVVECPEQPAEVGALPADDDRHVVPPDAVLDVQASELAGDRRVLLARVGRDPGLDRHALGRSMVRRQLDGRARLEHVEEALERGPARSLEREDVGAGIRRDDEVRGAQPAQDRLGRDRRVVVVVDEHVIERWLATEGFSGRALQDGREVGEVQRVEHLLVLTQEAGQLAPARQSPPIGGLDEVARARATPPAPARGTVAPRRRTLACRAADRRRATAQGPGPRAVPAPSRTARSPTGAGAAPRQSARPGP